MKEIYIRIINLINNQVFINCNPNRLKEQKYYLHNSFKITTSLLYLIIVSIIIIFFSGCNIVGCGSENNTKNNKFTKLLLSLQNNLTNNPVEQYSQMKEEVKQSILPNFSNIRPKPNLSSPRETMVKLIDEAFSNPERLLEILKKDCWEDTHFGDIILVDDYSTMRDHYYFVTVLDSKGDVIAKTTTITAVADDPLNGNFGTMNFTDANKVPMKYMSDNEATQWLLNKYSLDEAEKVQIKAINIQPGELDWGWAVKISKPKTVVDVNNVEVSGNIFFIYPRIFDLAWFDNKSEDKKTGFLRYLGNTPKLALIDEDIFDEEVSKKIKSLNKNSTKEEIDRIFPKLTVLEYMVQ